MHAVSLLHRRFDRRAAGAGQSPGAETKLVISRNGRVLHIFEFDPHADEIDRLLIRLADKGIEEQELTEA
jgi:hypothetical protein